MTPSATKIVPDTYRRTCCARLLPRTRPARAAATTAYGLAGRGESGGEQGDSVPTRARRLFWQGTLVNVLNPKTALFFLAFLPQFVDPDRGPVALQAAVLGASFVMLAALSDSTYAVVAAALAGRVRGSRRAQQVRRYVSGTIFVALGVTAAAARRT